MSRDNFDPGETAHKWWKELQDDSGARARLRRASTPVEALAEKCTIGLAKRLGASPAKSAQLARIGALAAVLAHVRDGDASTPMARQLGPDSKGENAAMSVLRFQRLMAAENPQDLMRQMRNAVKLLKDKANIEDLAHAIFYWNDRTRIRWTYDYWGASIATPETTKKQIQETTS